MLNYIAFVWNEADSTQRAAKNLLLKDASSDWSEVFSAAGVCVLCSNSKSHPEIRLLNDNRGVVLGALFTNPVEDVAATAFASGSIDDASTQRILRSEGRELISTCWGSYVAILNDPAQARTWVLRSPLGALPCLRTSFRGVQIFFSAMQAICFSKHISLSVDMSYVARHLGKRRQSGDTGLKEVTELRYGECARFDDRRGTHDLQRYWDPLDIARSERIENVTQAANDVRKTVRACVHAWASSHRTIQLRLSGGLDSSIVLSCLATAPTRPSVICVNRYSNRADCDEREYARLMARNAGCELIEMHRDPELDLRDVFDSRLTERPQNYLTQFGQALPEARLAQANGATAIFGGSYGDQLFSPSEYALTGADYIHDHGLRPQLFTVASSAAATSNESVWSILQESLAKGLTRHRWDRLEAARRFNLLMNEPALLALMGSAVESRPWYDPERYVPPGKQLQIANLMDSNAAGMPFAAAAHLEYVYPFLSQPVVELCLRIPSYVLSHNGWDREIERLAFAPDLPVQIARRRSKGSQGEFTAAVVKKNHALISELLLNGQLVASGLLHRSKLEQALAGRSSGLDRGPARLSRVLNIEVWLKLWSASQLRAAA